ncbi:MAG: hypothetical protein K2P79_04310 [Sphingomonas sp.]|nr:hypothetical protein [Sphingomonas sp.]
MIARLLLILMMMGLTAPVAARGCHAPAAWAADAAMSAHHHAPKPHHETPIAAEQMCLGCIPPSSWRATVIAAPLLPAPLPRRTMLARIDRVAPTPPALPPPRRG